MTSKPAGPGEVRYRYVLVPSDGSRAAAAAAQTGRALAARLGAELHAVSVAEHADEVGMLRREAATVLGPDSTAEHVHVVVGDDPAAAIAETAAGLGSSLVCMSTHGRGRVTGAVVGSVARSLLQTTREPIVAVGPFADRPRPFSSTIPVPLSCRDGRSHDPRPHRPPPGPARRRCGEYRPRLDRAGARRAARRIATRRRRPKGEVMGTAPPSQ